MSLSIDKSELKKVKDSKRNSTIVKSPTHIFDSDLYHEWEEKNSKSVSPPQESKEIQSIDIETVESDSFSISFENGVFSTKWSPDGQYLAIGCADGGVRILTNEGRLAYRIKTSGGMPVTTMKWRPSLSGVGSSNTLVTGSASGSLDFWHVQSQKSIYSIVEQDNQIFCFDFSPNIEKFATAGKDKAVRIYDDKTKKLMTTLEKGFMAKHPGHSNRIFALKWKSDDENILVSGGWDNTVLFWDLRSNTCFRSIYGPHIAGSTIDIQNEVLVTGSWRIKETIQTWDFRTGKVLKTIQWKPSPMIYACSFSPTLENIVAAGGTGVNTMRLINVKTGAKTAPIQLDTKKGIFCLDWNPNGTRIAFGGQSSSISIVDAKFIKKDLKNKNVL